MSEILPYLQAYNSSLDAGRKQETPRSETKDFITAQQASCASYSPWFPLVPVHHGGIAEWIQVDVTHTVDLYHS